MVNCGILLKLIFHPSNFYEIRSWNPGYSPELNRMIQKLFHTKRLDTLNFFYNHFFTKRSVLSPHLIKYTPFCKLLMSICLALEVKISLPVRSVIENIFP